MTLNPYLENLNRIEFIITYACTGRCKHCSVGEGNNLALSIDKSIAVSAVLDTARLYDIKSVMTFGGEPLLYPDTVCAIHSAARDAGIPHRQLITNGFFSKDKKRIKQVAFDLADSGVTDLRLSADAFHQEVIPLECVKEFGFWVKKAGINVHSQPAWLQSPKADNPYNKITRAVLNELAELGIEECEGNVVFPQGNALKYLSEYFDKDAAACNPYEEDPAAPRTASIEPDGTVFGGNLYTENIESIFKKYLFL